jgi:hypothetical protein
MRYVVTPFVDETYPDNVAFLAIHLSDGYQTAFGQVRRNGYYPGTMYIPDAIVDGGVSHYVGYRATCRPVDEYGRRSATLPTDSRSRFCRAG